MSEKREDGMTDQGYWESFLEFFPHGWYLSGYSYRMVALFSSEDDSCTFTEVHAKVIRNAYWKGSLK
jgi:hypothetical protein